MSLVTLRNPDTGEQVAVEDTTPFVGWDQISPGQLLTDLQADKWNCVKAIRARELALAPTVFGTAQADVASMVKINGLVSMAILARQAEAAFSETFTMADNSEVVMTAEEMIAFGIAVGGHIADVHAHGRALRAAIEATTSAEALAAIDVEAGWP